MSLARVVGHRSCGLVTVVLCATQLLLFVSVFGITVFEVHWGAAARDGMIALGLPTVDYYTIWDLFFHFLLIRGSTDFGVIFVSTCLMLFAVVMPLVHVGLILVLWFVPLRSVAQYRLWMFSQVMLSWGAFDIFVLAIGLSWIFSDSVSKFVHSSALHHQILSPTCQLLADIGLDCLALNLEVTPWTLLPLCAAACWHLSNLYIYFLMIRVRDGHQDVSCSEEVRRSEM
jgi:hypothetical protein